MVLDDHVSREYWQSRDDIGLVTARMARCSSRHAGHFFFCGTQLNRPELFELLFVEKKNAERFMEQEPVPEEAEQLNTRRKKKCQVKGQNKRIQSPGGVVAVVPAALPGLQQAEEEQFEQLVIQSSGVGRESRGGISNY